MKTSAVGKFLMLFVFFALTTGGCGEKNKENKNDGLKDEKTDNRVKSANLLGPAGKVVQSFFKNWEFKRYKQMYAQTVHSRNEEIFVKHMKETPIRWQNLTILSEEPSGDDWNVTLSIEVTDVVCTFVACMVNLEYPPEPEFNQPSFRMSPAFLGIQRFMLVKQTWRVINLDGEYFIDVCAAGSKGKRHQNIMNYVLDTSDLDSFPSALLASSEKEKVTIAASAWLAVVCLDMDISVEDTEGIMQESLPLFRKAKKNFKDLVDKIKSLHGKDDKKAKSKNVFQTFSETNKGRSNCYS